MHISPETAELCGIILGDGNIHKTCNRITISGSADDLYYFQRHVIPLFISCFPGVTPRLVRLKTAQAYNLEIENKAMLQFFMSVYGLKRGPKDNAKIPSVILNRSDLIPHFLRGLFDTDGCLKFDKQTRTYAYYPRVRFFFCDCPFAHQLQVLFEKLSIKAPKLACNNHGFKKTSKVVIYEISGVAALEYWMREIHPANPVQIAKYLFWKQHGFHIPGLSLSERLFCIGSGGFEPPSTGPEPAILGL